MSRDKQIEEMAKTMCFQADSCTVKSCVQVNCEKTWLAESLYNAGYRRASDVAREIFEEIENTARSAIILLKFERNKNIQNIKTECYQDLIGYIAELKKKYTEEGK